MMIFRFFVVVLYFFARYAHLPFAAIGRNTTNFVEANENNEQRVTPIC